MPCRIAFLGKYPPLEGGISAKTYWLSRGLAERGHSVHIVTHRIESGKEYSFKDYSDSVIQIPDVHIHRPDTEIPWHIPENNEYALELLDLTIRVVRENNVQVLDTGYLVPFGIIGHMVKNMTGVRHVMRHGGSDIEKFLKKKILNTVLEEAISNSDTVITDRDNENVLAHIAPRLICQAPYIPDDSFFCPSATIKSKRRVAFIGKINYYWQHKGLNNIIKIMHHLSEQFECWIVGQGNGINAFRDNIGKEIASHLIWTPFVPPWEMPDLLRKFDAIFTFESELPFPAFSNLAMEALYSGVGIITDNHAFADRYSDLITIDNKQFLVVLPSESITSAKIIMKWIEEKSYAEQSPAHLISFEEYIRQNETIYNS